MQLGQLEFGPKIDRKHEPTFQIPSQQYGTLTCVFDSEENFTIQLDLKLCWTLMTYEKFGTTFEQIMILT